MSQLRVDVSLCDGRVETAVRTLLDTGVAGALSGLTADRLASLDPALLTAFGGILESFVVGEVLKQVSWAEEPLEIGHFRTHDGVEADIVIEGSDARIAAIEVKASSQVRPTDLRDFACFVITFPTGSSAARCSTWVRSPTPPRTGSTSCRSTASGCEPQAGPAYQAGLPG